ncbi:hypothetical protein ACQEV2_41965 [Streptomyces sp. CA-251387]|uniref:hypothetical protein n=1 Tax=Streptomyces sp. CA-251387 TaxID=3240064 RepID=UPI003D931A29
MEADLIVCATGRATPLGRWLAAIGAGPIAEERAECGLTHYSRHYRLRSGLVLPAGPWMLGGPRGETPGFSFAVFPGDNRTFSLMQTVRADDRALHNLHQENAFTTAASAQAPLGPFLECADPITPVRQMGRLHSQWRSLVAGGHPAVLGLHLVGDVQCHTNPVYGHGASDAVSHAHHLAQIVDQHPDLRDQALAYDVAVSTNTRTRFQVAAVEDRDRLRHWTGELTEGDITPDRSIALYQRHVIYPAAACDPILARAVCRQINLLDPGDSLQHNPEILARAARAAPHLAQPPCPPAPSCCTGLTPVTASKSGGEPLTERLGACAQTPFLPGADRHGLGPIPAPARACRCVLAVSFMLSNDHS